MRTSRRVFFALWPEAATAAYLDALAATAHVHCGGRRMRCDTLHLTLAFIGAADAARIDALREMAGRLHETTFALHLDRLARWDNNRIVWAGCRTQPPPLVRLAGQLAAGAGLREERAFTAHVSLLRDTRDAPGDLPVAIDWPVREFLFVESKPSGEGPQYVIIDRWPLAMSA